jgi:hypothetical protein
VKRYLQPTASTRSFAAVKQKRCNCRAAERSAFYAYPRLATSGRKLSFRLPRVRRRTDIDRTFWSWSIHRRALIRERSATERHCSAPSNAVSVDAFSIKAKIVPGRQPAKCRCGLEPRLLHKLLDPSSGQMISIYKCACGEQAWLANKE